MTLTPSAASTSATNPVPTQRVPFGPLEISYDERVLRPRAWTAAQAAWAEELLADAPPGPVLELCTGAGQIGLLAVVRSDRRLVAVDRDPVACEYARANAAAAGLSDRVEVREGTAEQSVRPDERFALVVADPPWVPTAGTEVFPDDPVGAIDGGEDGLEVARACVAVAARHLVSGGSLVLQLGTWDQVAALSEELRPQADLAVRDVRRPHPRGVLVRLERA